MERNRFGEELKEKPTDIIDEALSDALINTPANVESNLLPSNEKNLNEVTKSEPLALNDSVEDN
mgnify:CR=1 FL=1